MQRLRDEKCADSTFIAYCNYNFVPVLLLLVPVNIGIGNCAEAWYNGFIPRRFESPFAMWRG